MFVDASVLTAILTSESDAQAFEKRLYEAESELITSPLAIFETVLAVARKNKLAIAKAEIEVMSYVLIDMRVVAVTTEIGSLAIKARARYGKGTGHLARLNLGDCFAYACAKAHAVPLLYKGDDFVHTDLA